MMYWEEWALLDPSQKCLYKDVMLETYRNRTEIDNKWEDHNIEEHCENSGRHNRRLQSDEAINTGEKPMKVCNMMESLQETITFRYIKAHVLDPLCIILVFEYTEEHTLEKYQCGNAFYCQSHLQRHKRTHIGEKPYGCNQCGKAFAQDSDLQIHKRTPIGDKPSECLQCGNAFAGHRCLQRHKRTHTGEKP